MNNDDWIDHYLRMIAQARVSLVGPVPVRVGDLTTPWGVAIREGHGHGLRVTAYRCWVCAAAVSNLLTHRAVHRAEAERLRDEDLVPLTLQMRDVLRCAHLGFEDAVKVADTLCLPRPLAVLLVTIIDHRLLCWAFNRVRHDAAFADAILAAHHIPQGVVNFVSQQYGEYRLATSNNTGK